MARKNGNAGQPNRIAQVDRRSKRRYNAEKFERRYSPVLDGPVPAQEDTAVYGPGSEFLIQTKIEVRV